MFISPVITTDRAKAVSVGEMVRLTGIKAERLRSWERRHGFPVARRLPNGHRCYTPDDVEQVIAVSQAVRGGLRLEDAIAEIRDRPLMPDTPDQLSVLAEAEAILGAAPIPAMLIAGDHRLRIIWKNAVLGAAGMPLGEETGLLDLQPGLEGSPSHDAILQVLNGGLPSAFVEHDDWTAPVRRPARSIAWRPRADASEPVVLLAQQADASAAFAATNGHAHHLHDPSTDQMAWCNALEDAREALRHHDQERALQRSVAALTRRIGAVDALIATYAIGSLHVGRSIRGEHGGNAVGMPTGSAMNRSLVDGAIDWLPEDERAALGVSSRLQVMIVPLIAPGERVGALFLAFRDELPLESVMRELLLQYGTTLALTIVQRRAVRGS